MNRGYNTFRTNFRSVILSEASAGFADAESKDPYSLEPFTGTERLFNTHSELFVFSPAGTHAVTCSFSSPSPVGMTRNLRTPCS